MQSPFEGEEKEVKPFVADYGMVIVDECHHVAAFTFEKVLKAVKVKYVYGLSATPTRKDGHHPHHLHAVRSDTLSGGCKESGRKAVI